MNSSTRSFAPFIHGLVLAAAGLLVAAGAAAAQVTSGLDEDLLKAFKWRSIGPANIGGRVTDVEGLPFPSKTFYVATATSGIWKTTNNGTSFQSIWENPRVVSMGDLAIAPSDPNQIWAGTGEEDSRNSISPGGGIFKSTDAGMTWELKGLVETQVIGRIVVHPGNPDIVYVAALGHIWDSNPERGLYRTTDGGDTWELIKHISDKAGFVDIAMHPRDPNMLFAASWERQRGPWFLQSGGPGSALWKSTDGGDTWTEVVGNGFPTKNKGRIGLAISQSYPNEANSRPFYYSQVRVDPQDPDRLYFSSTPLQFSDDGGKTAGTTTNGIHVDHHAMWIDPVDPERMIVGNDGGVAITFDRGGNWITLNHVATGQFYAVSYNMDTPYRVCGGLQDNGLWCAPSRLAGQPLNNHYWMDIHFGDGFISEQDPVDHDLVWTESQGGNMARQNLATGDRTTLEKPDWEKVWRPYQDSILALTEEGVEEDDPRIQALREQASADSALADQRWNWNTPFFQSVHDRSHFYAASNVVLKSTDWGDGLEAISPDLSYADPEKVEVSLKTTGGITPDITGAETYATIVSLAESPLQQGLIYAGTDDGRVWMTRDDGGEWTELTDRFSGVPANTYVSRIEPSSHDASRVYVTFDGHRTNDFTPYVFVTDDGGRSFRSIVSNLPTGSVDFVHVIREDPQNESLLFVGTDLGAYVSTNRGASWQRFMEGMPTVPVHDLKIHPRDRELIAGTHGRAIWIVDIAPLQDLSDAVLAEEATLFEPKPAFQFGLKKRGGESYGQAWFARPTPGSVGHISYRIGQDLAADLQTAFEAEQEEAKKAAEAEAAAKAEAAAEAGEEAGAEAAAAPKPPAGAMAAMGGRGKPPAGAQVELTLSNGDGEVIRTLKGPASAGLHTVTWDLRMERPAAAPMSPSKKRDSMKAAQRAKHVSDSLAVEGWDAAVVKRITGLFTGETSPMAVIAAFMGGGGGGEPEAFRERPGESMGGGTAAFGSVSMIREIAELVLPGAGMATLMRQFMGSGSSPAPLAEPGTYTVTLTAGDRTLTREITVERVGTYEGKSSMFEADGRLDF
jgi:photosystem II stability/assembly factor-like uncharacterized protein